MGERTKTKKEKKKYFPPNLYGTWGKNIILQKKRRGGGKNMIFGGNI